MKLQPLRCALLTLGLMQALAAGADEVRAPATPSAAIAHPGDLAWVLPIHSTRLSPGDVPRRVLALPGMTPLFLVGQDPQSLEWLAAHAEELRALGATGLAVEVKDQAALQRIQTTAPALTIWPVSGDDLSERLNVEHYPVLITRDGLEQ